VESLSHQTYAQVSLSKKVIQLEKNSPQENVFLKTGEKSFKSLPSTLTTSLHPGKWLRQKKCLEKFYKLKWVEKSRDNDGD